MKVLKKWSRLLFLTLKEVNIMNELRGYDSVLEQTNRSNLKKETLEAMLATMMDYRVYFRVIKSKSTIFRLSKRFTFLRTIRSNRFFN